MAARSAFRSFGAVRTAISRISTAANGVAKHNATSSARSAFRIPSHKNPFAHRIFWSPVELSSVSVESMLPFHTATASALLTSMLYAAPRTCGWTLEGL